MLFTLSKTIGFLLLPSNVIGGLAVVGLLALPLRKRGPAFTALGASGALLVVCGWTPVGSAAILALENRFPQPVLQEPISGVILLGGAVDTHITADRGLPTLNEGAERLTATAALARRYPQARIFLSGGANHAPSAETVTESGVARDLLVSIGVASERIESEEASRTTFENGLRSAEALKPAPGDRWLLVTSATQMPRAVASFRAAGFDVIPYPVDFRTQGAADLQRPPRSVAVGLELADLAAHEWIGLTAYRLFAKTQELFPAP